MQAATGSRVLKSHFNEILLQDVFRCYQNTTTRNNSRNALLMSPFLCFPEVIAFPAGGIAAIIIASIVLLMVIVKIVCVLSGFENRVPPIVREPEDLKQTLLSDTGSTGRGTARASTTTQSTTRPQGKYGPVTVSPE